MCSPSWPPPRRRCGACLEMVLAEHMRTCVVEEVRAGNDEVIDEVMALMRRFSK